MKRRQDYVPPGWEYFLTLLKKHNIPKFALNHETLKEIDFGIKAVPPSKVPALKTRIKKEIDSNIKPSKLPLPKQWFKKSPTTSRGRSPSSSTPKQRRAKRDRAPPKKFMFSNY
jgi:hypothetical protein